MSNVTKFKMTARFMDGNFVEKERHSFNCFSFTRLMDLSPQELNRIALGDLIFRWLYVICQLHRRDLMLYRQQWWEDVGVCALVNTPRESLRDYVFTAHNGNECVFSFGTETHRCMPETMEHRLLRMRKIDEIGSVRGRGFVRRLWRNGDVIFIDFVGCTKRKNRRSRYLSGYQSANVTRVSACL